MRFSFYRLQSFDLKSKRRKVFPIYFAILSAIFCICKAVPARALDFSMVNGKINSFRRRSNINEATAIQVTDQSGGVVYEREVGSPTDTPKPLLGDSMFDQRVGMASATKIASSLLLFALITNDDLRLNSTTSEVLGWTGSKGRITIEMLGFMVRRHDVQNY